MSSATTTVRKLLDAVGSLERTQVLALLHEDLMFELPFEREKPTLNKSGFERMYDGIVAGFGRFDMNIVELIETADPQRVVALYNGDCMSRDGTVSYRNSYISVFTVTNAAVLRWCEYSNPVLTARMVQQLGVLELG